MWALSLKSCCVEVDQKCTVVSGKRSTDLKGLLLGTVTKWWYLVAGRKALCTVMRNHCLSIANKTFTEKLHFCSSKLFLKFYCPINEGLHCLCHGKWKEES